LAIWTSAYESAVLFLLAMIVNTFEDGKAVFGKSRRAQWLWLVLVIAIAFLIERRIPSFPAFHSDAIFKNWAHTIGELAHVSPTNPIWLRWTGYLLLVTPVLICASLSKDRRRRAFALPAFVLVLLIVTYVLTIWQARWGYFFVLLFALALPSLLESIKSCTAVWIAFVVSLFPILRDWDQRIWPNDAELARRVERRNEAVELRELALSLRSSEIRPFLAPWWFSPSIAYWSRQPGLAGSSHESLNGIGESARFFLSEDLPRARQILQNHGVDWVVVYDFERAAQNSEAVLGRALPAHPLCLVLDRTPAQAPPFLIFSAQNGAFKLYRTALTR
jgi:hypothetical protein